MTPKNFQILSGERIHQNSPGIHILISALEGIGPSSAEAALKVKDTEEFKKSWPWYVLSKELQNSSVFSREPMWIEVVACCLVVLALEEHRHYEWFREDPWVFAEHFDDDIVIYCEVDDDGVFPSPQEWEKALESHRLESLM